MAHSFMGRVRRHEEKNCPTPPLLNLPRAGSSIPAVLPLGSACGGVARMNSAVGAHALWQRTNVLHSAFIAYSALCTTRVYSLHDMRSSSTCNIFKSYTSSTFAGATRFAAARL